MGLRDIGSSLPPGFRFYPSDEELVCHYLYKKVANEEVDMGTLMEINLHTCEPWQLPEGAKLNSSEWYFFSFRDRKYATGFRTNRATNTGYWKATGKDRLVCSSATQAVVGMRKTLVFYQNRAPNGIKTGWIMHEFRLENPHTPPKLLPQVTNKRKRQLTYPNIGHGHHLMKEDWVLCRVFHKGKGENYGNQLSPQNYDLENTTSLMLSPPKDQTLLYGNYQNQANTSFSHNPPCQQDSSLLNPSFLHLSTQEVDDDAPLRDLNSMLDHDYGFLFDMDFEESNIGDAMVPTNLKEITRYSDDNSLVFL